MIFNEYRIEEICKNIKYGTMPKKERISDTGKYNIWSGYRIVGKYDEYNIDEDQVVVVARGVGGTGDVKYSTEKCYLTNLSIALDVNKSIVLPKYIYYYYQIKNLRYLDSGSAQSQITINDLKNVVVPIPSMKLQLKIVKILEFLDNKINLNTKINNNLYELSHQLLKNYLETVDADEIRISELLNVFTGKKNANETSVDGKYKFFSCAPESLLSDTYIHDGAAIIVAGNGAYTGRTRFYEGKFELYQRTYALTLKDNLNKNLIYGLYVYMKSYFEKDKIGGTHGSAIPYIVLSDLTDYKLKYNKIEFERLSNNIACNIKKIQENEKMNETLSQLRDTLLPKLMNGEIDLDNIEI